MTNETYKVVSPVEMIEILYAPYPDEVKGGFQWASLDMLKTLYNENSDQPKVQEAKLALKTALSKWNDQTVREFLLNYLLQPPQSTELQTKSTDELRAVLQSIYNHLFE